MLQIITINAYMQFFKNTLYYNMLRQAHNIYTQVGSVPIYITYMQPGVQNVPKC